MKGSAIMKLGIVGTGQIAKEIMPFLRSWGWTVEALCGTPRSAETVRELCAAHDIPLAYTDYPAMLREAAVDAVYIATPNSLHYEFTKQALEAGRNVILEKPMTSHHRETEELSELAREKNLYLFEAVTTLYMPCYEKIKEWLPRIGTVKLVSCNFSQYSSRYDAFRAGNTPPVFDPAKSGGALMDLNLYNLHYLVGLFGRPQDASYHPNLERGIDTSGVLLLDYGSFRAVSIAAKDSSAPPSYIIQGTEGYIRQDMPANTCSEAILHLNDGTEEHFRSSFSSRLEPEFRAFAKEIASESRDDCYSRLEHSLLVSRILTSARLGAGIRFPTDPGSGA